VQFLVKFLVAMGAGLLGGLLLWIAEGIGSAMGAAPDMDFFRSPFMASSLGKITLLFSGLILAAVYGSSLTRNVVQALGVGAMAALAHRLVNNFMGYPFPISGIDLWRGPIGLYFSIPIVVSALLWLSYRNFRTAPQGWPFWRRNVLVLVGALSVTVLSASAVYYRAWELVMPLESSPGSARLNASTPAVMKVFGNQTMSVLLADGRLWVESVYYERGKTILGNGEDRGFCVGGKWISLSGNRFEAGTNWADVAAYVWETVAIRSDGSLWISETNLTARHFESGMPLFEQHAPLLQYGTEINWKSVSFAPVFGGPVLLKRDGTLWLWNQGPRDFFEEGGRSVKRNDPRHSHLQYTPHQLGASSDWARIMGPGWVSSIHRIYAWKRDGTAWSFCEASGKAPDVTEIEPGIAMQRLPAFDNLKWKSLSESWPYHAAVADDGTLWAWRIQPEFVSPNIPNYFISKPGQLYPGKDWMQVSCTDTSIVALRKDGSLWSWKLTPPDDGREPESEPVRLGNRNDWIAIGNLFGETAALSADGTIWLWWNRNRPQTPSADQPMMMASRRPSRVDNILGIGRD
jgi:hypothetical protein